MNPYGYGAPPPYPAPPPAYGYCAQPAPYGAPPSYGAPPTPYAAPPTPAYGAPPPPYGVPPAPYGAPYGAPPYGAHAYGAPPAPYGAPAPSPYGVPPPGAPQPPGAASATPSAPAPTAPPATPGSVATSQAQPQPQPSVASAPAAPPASQPPQQPAPQSLLYPSLTAPRPAHTASLDSGGTGITNYAGSSQQQQQQQRPASAYPNIGGGGPGPGPGTGPTAPPFALDLVARPASAAPGQAPPPYGAPHAAYSPQPPTAPFTYGQLPPHAGAALPPTPYMAPTTYSPAPGHGGRRRRAVLVGCSYPGSSSALNGCLNDVQCIQYCLTKRFGFKEQEMVVLRDDAGRHHDFTSTKANIYRAIHWLMTDQRPGDSLFFHFSGHGSQQYDRNGDEEDGYDETICPSDFRRAGQIVDDELNRLMVRPLMAGLTLHAVIDACHSGTALDLPYRAKVDGAGRWYWKGRARYDKMTAGGTAFQFGACKDSQVAADTKALSGYAYTGAATFCFIQAIEKYGVDQTYGQILSHMTQALRATTGAPGLNLGPTSSLIASFLLGSAATALTSGGQTPVLSCDKQVDLYGTKISL